MKRFSKLGSAVAAFILVLAAGIAYANISFPPSSGSSSSGSSSTSTVPAGTLYPYMSSTAPTGYFLTNGAALTTSTNAGLFAAIGYLFSSNTTSSFNIPNISFNFPTYGSPPAVSTSGLWASLNFNGSSSLDSGPTVRPTVDTAMGYNGNFGVFNGIGAYFNGASSKIALPSSTFGAANFTIHFWMNPSGTTANWILGSDQGSGANPKWLASYNGDTANAWALRYSQGASLVNFGVTSISVGAWQAIDITRCGNTFSLYTNGVLTTTTVASVTFDSVAASTTWGFAEGALFYGGSLDETRIYNRCLQGSEIQNLYNTYNYIIKT